MNWFTEGDFETSFLRTGMVITGIAFLVMAALEIENAMAGEGVELPLLVTVGGGFLTLVALTYSSTE